MRLLSRIRGEELFSSVSIFEGSGNPALAHIRAVERSHHQELASFSAVFNPGHELRRIDHES
jgi:hypothetical protein